MTKLLLKLRCCRLGLTTGEWRHWAWLLVVIAVAVSSKPLLTPPAADQPWERITVQPGDTLWRLADQRAAAAEDVRLVVRDIQRANALETAAILPGQVLLVPPIPPERGEHLQ